MSDRITIGLFVGFVEALLFQLVAIAHRRELFPPEFILSCVIANLILIALGGVMWWQRQKEDPRVIIFVTLVGIAIGVI